MNQSLDTDPVVEGVLLATEQKHARALAANETVSVVTETAAPSFDREEPRRMASAVVLWIEYQLDTTDQRKVTGVAIIPP